LRVFDRDVAGKCHGTGLPRPEKDDLASLADEV